MPQTTVSGSVLMFYSMVGVMSKAVSCKGQKVTLERNVKKGGFQSSQIGMQHSWVSEGVIMVYNGGYECLCMDINKLYTSVTHIYFENILIGN